VISQSHPAYLAAAKPDYRDNAGVGGEALNLMGTFALVSTVNYCGISLCLFMVAT
jgi:hypothetical protein